MYRPIYRTRRQALRALQRRGKGRGTVTVHAKVEQRDWDAARRLVVESSWAGPSVDVVAQAIADARAEGCDEKIKPWREALRWALATLDILLRNDAMEPAMFERYEAARALLEAEDE